MLKYAIIGFGGLGKLLLVTLKRLEKERGDLHLQAICGADPAALKQKVKLNIGTVDLSELDFSGCALYSDYKEMLDKENLDFVLSVLPTYLHEEVACYAFEKGVHVFSEKPMALTYEGCLKMLSAMEKAGKKLMVGQCLRFHPAYAKLKEYVDENTFGKPYRAEFSRYSPTPSWTWNNWILDPALSGGCALDMHVHDVDMIYHLFGMPNALRSSMTDHKVPREGIFTEYFYDGLLVSSRADWSLPQTFPFEARCIVNFEEATVVVEGDKLTVYKDSGVETPMLLTEDCYAAELRAFVKMVSGEEDCKISTPQSVSESVKLALTEVQSATEGKTVYFNEEK